jgi:transposase
MRFGVRSEALDAETRDLFQETLASDVAAAEAELARRQAEAEETPAAARPKRDRAGRQPLPEHLTRIEHRHEPESCTCGKCGKDLVLIGEDVSEQLDVEPAKFFVHRHIRPQYACRACETVTAAPIPPAVIDGGMAATGLLAWVIIGKYLDHLPLYRLERIAARDGVTLARSTLAEWVGRIGVALQPLADRLTTHLLERPVLHADETPVQQLDPGSGKTKRAYLWAYMSNVLETGPPIVVFDYQTSRSGAHARNFLGEWKGALMVDDFGGYKALFGQEVTELGCFAHARRKYFELNEAQANPIAQEALLRIAALYAIEARGRDMSIAQRADAAATGSAAVAGVDARLVEGDAHDGGQWGWHRQGDRLQSEALAGTLPLREQWRPADRQQPGRERHPSDLPGQEELALHGFRARRQACRCDSELARDRRTQRPRSGRLAAHDLGETSTCLNSSTGSRRLNPRGRVGRIRTAD